MKIERFEDLQAWQEARVLVSEIYRAVRLSNSLKQDRRFRDQITSAAVSVMSNMAEGFSRRSDREFTQYLFIAKGSRAEVQSLLYVALDQEYINHTEETPPFEAGTKPMGFPKGRSGSSPLWSNTGIQTPWSI